MVEEDSLFDGTESIEEGESKILQDFLRLDGDVTLFSLPVSVTLADDLFEPEKYEEMLNLDELSMPKTILQPPNPDAIRFRKTESGGVECNAKLVTFDDGSYALVVGRKKYTAVPVKEECSQIIDCSNEDLFYKAGNVTGRAVFMKTIGTAGALKESVESDSLQPKQVKLTTVAQGAESESNMRRHYQNIEDKKLAASSSKKRKLGSSEGLNAKFLEDSDEEDE